MTRSTFTEQELALLVEAGAAREFLVQRTEDSAKGNPRWVLLVRRRMHWVPVRSKRENPRTWASLDSLERFTKELGIASFQVES